MRRRKKWGKAMLLLAVSLNAFTASAGDRLLAGEAGHLQSPIKGTPVAFSKEAFEEFRACFNAENKQCIGDMVRSSEVLMFKNGTGVTVVEIPFWSDLVRVRVPRYGREGVDAERVDSEIAHATHS